jgi:hypothetical protein
MWLFYLGLLAWTMGCSQKTSETEQSKEPQISSFSGLADLCTEEKCTIQQCQGWYATKYTVESKDLPSIQKLCLFTEKGGDALHQQCGMPACFILPQYDTKVAQDILLSSLPQRSAQKMSRQAIFRGYLQKPKSLAGLFDDAEMMKKNDRWIGVLIAEMECTEGSVARQMNLECRDRYPILSEILWRLITESKMETEQTMQSILHLMVLFDLDVGLKNMQSLFDAKNNSEKVKVKLALQVLYIQYMKDSQSISKSLLQEIHQTCLDSKSPEIQRGCILWQRL